jgi:plasmid stabilization system protein ParE
MASPERTLTVVLSPTAIDELHGVWLRNAEHYSPLHADTYVRYLKGRIYDLSWLYMQGKTVIGRPNLRYIIIRRKAKGHGHLAVYRVDDQEVNVLHVFHSAQDWQAKLAGES